MKQKKKAIKGLRKQLKSDPGNLVLRVRLASLLREIGSYDESVTIFLLVAKEYREKQKLAQAIAVCQGILEFAPERDDVATLIAELQTEQTRMQAKPNIHAKPKVPSRPPPMPQLPRMDPMEFDAISSGEVPALPPAKTERVRRIAEHSSPHIPPQRPLSESMPEVDATVIGAAPAPFQSSPVLDYPGDEPAENEELVDEDEPTRIAPDASYEHFGAESDVSSMRSETVSERPGRRRQPRDTQLDSRPRPPAAPPPLRKPAAASDYDSADATVVDSEFSGDATMPRFLESPPPVPADSSKLMPFAHLPDEALAELGRHVIMRRYQAGDIVLREGEFGDSCFVIVSGDVRILKRDPLDSSADLHEVARLTDGDLFGEFALLGDRKRHATVQSVGGCSLYEVPRKVVNDLGERYPVIKPILQRFYRERMLQTLMATAGFFRPLEPSRHAEVIKLFSHERYPAGHPIIHEGARSGGFFLILLGTVEIQKRVEQRRNVSLATLGEGAYFGELSLLRGDVARATVVATSPVEVARLEAKHFYSLVAGNPVLWSHVWEEANRRELETLRIVAGVTGTV
jgi:cAMP-dependent protein kinase regulator